MAAKSPWRQRLYEEHAIDDADPRRERTMASDNGLIYVYWAACKSCGYTTAVHGRVACPDCGETMAPYEIAGAVVNDEEPTGTGTDDE